MALRLDTPVKQELDFLIRRAILEQIDPTGVLIAAVEHILGQAHVEEMPTTTTSLKHPAQPGTSSSPSTAASHRSAREPGQQ
jgi:hypothetical protein